MLKRILLLSAALSISAGCDSISPEFLRSLLGAVQTDGGIASPGGGEEPPIGAPGDPGAPHEPAPAVRIFVMFEGIKGEVMELAHDGWIECSAYRTAIQAPEVDAGGGGGIDVGLPEFAPFELVIPFERAVPEIVDRLLGIIVIEKAMVDVVDPANSRLLTRYELKNVLISSVKLSANPEQAEVSIIFNQFRLTRPIYDDSGKQVSETSACFNIVTGQNC